METKEQIKFFIGLTLIYIIPVFIAMVVLDRVFLLNRITGLKISVVWFVFTIIGVLLLPKFKVIEKKSYKCEWCGKSFKSGQSLGGHTKFCQNSWKILKRKIEND